MLSRIGVGAGDAVGPAVGVATSVGTTTVAAAAGCGDGSKAVGAAVGWGEPRLTATLGATNADGVAAPESGSMGRQPTVNSAKPIMRILVRIASPMKQYGPRRTEAHITAIAGPLIQPLDHPRRTLPA